MLLGGAHRHGLVHDGAHRELVDQPIDAEHRQRAALAAGHDGLAQGLSTVGLQVQRLLDAVIGVLRPGAMRLHAHRVDAGIGATSSRHFLQHVQHAVDLRVVDGLGTGVGDRAQRKRRGASPAAPSPATMAAPPPTRWESSLNCASSQRVNPLAMPCPLVRQRVCLP